MRSLTPTLLATVALLLLAAPASAATLTGFEQRDGASWTTHEEELTFLPSTRSPSRRGSA
jgi:hypothetical protein